MKATTSDLKRRSHQQKQSNLAKNFQISCLRNGVCLTKGAENSGTVSSTTVFL